MNEIELYRAKLQRKWDRRVTKRGGRRVLDSSPVKFWTFGLVLQLIIIGVVGLLAGLLAGCRIYFK